MIAAFKAFALLAAAAFVGGVLTVFAFLITRPAVDLSDGIGEEEWSIIVEKPEQYHDTIIQMYYGQPGDGNVRGAAVRLCTTWQSEDCIELLEHARSEGDGPASQTAAEFLNERSQGR